MQIERQWALLMALPDHRSQRTTEEIWRILSAEMHDVSKRTVERDLLHLSTIFSIGQRTDGRTNYWFWNPGEKVWLPGLNEARILRVALQPPSFESKIIQHVPGFVGREWIFDAYNHWVEHEKESRLFWIKAGPGIGKSAIAANLAHRQRKEVFATWFCDAKSNERKDPSKAIKSIAFQLALRWEEYRARLMRALHLYVNASDDACDEARKELDKKSSQDLFLTLLAEPMKDLDWNQHKLVIVVDALDEAADENGSNRITELIGRELRSLPQWVGFVVTSRPEADVVDRLRGFKPYVVDAEDPRNLVDVRLWYKEHLGGRPELTKLSDAERQSLEDLVVERSNGMFLYLKTVEEDLNEGTITANQLRQQLETGRSGLPGLYGRYYDSFQDRFGSDYGTSAKPLLRLLFAAGGPLPEDLACETLGWNGEQFLTCRNRLGSFVVETPGGHELFHDTLTEWLNDTPSGPFHLDAALGRQMLADVLFKEVADAEFLSVRWRRPIEEWLPAWLPHLSQRENPILLTRLANILLDDGEATKARPIIEHAVAILEKTRGPEHIEIAESLDTLAEVLLCEIDIASDEPDFSVAEPIIRRTLRIREKTLGPEHPDVGRNLRELADQLRRTGRHAEAEPLYRRSLEIAECAQVPDERGIADRMSRLARTMEKLGNYSDAETFFRRALAMTEKIYGVEHSFSIMRRNNLADLLCKSGNYSEAEPLYRQSLVISEQNSGLDHTTRVTLDKLISLLEAQGHTDATWTERRQQLGRFEQSMGPEHLTTLHILHDLAIALRNSGRLDEAEPLQHEAMERFIRVYGEDNLKTAHTYSAMGELLKLKGEKREAETLFLKALAIRERELGPEAELTQLIKKRLAEVKLVKKKSGKNDSNL